MKYCGEPLFCVKKGFPAPFPKKRQHLRAAPAGRRTEIPESLQSGRPRSKGSIDILCSGLLGHKYYCKIRSGFPPVIVCGANAAKTLCLTGLPLLLTMPGGKSVNRRMQRKRLHGSPRHSS